MSVARINSITTCAARTECRCSLSQLLHTLCSVHQPWQCRLTAPAGTTHCVAMRPKPYTIPAVPSQMMLHVMRPVWRTCAVEHQGFRTTGRQLSCPFELFPSQAQKGKARCVAPKVCCCPTSCLVPHLSQRVTDILAQVPHKVVCRVFEQRVRGCQVVVLHGRPICMGQQHKIRDSCEGSCVAAHTMRALQQLHKTTAQTTAQRQRVRSGCTAAMRQAHGNRNPRPCAPFPMSLMVAHVLCRCCARWLSGGVTMQSQSQFPAMCTIPTQAAWCGVLPSWWRSHRCI